MSEINIITDQKRKEFFMVDNLMVDRIAPKIGLTGFAIYIALTRWAGQTESCWPSMAKLAEKLGTCENTIRSGLQILVDEKLIRVVSRLDPTSRRKTNEYQLLPYPVHLLPLPAEYEPHPSKNEVESSNASKYEASIPQNMRPINTQDINIKNTLSGKNGHSSPSPDSRVKHLVDRFFESLEKKLGERPAGFNGAAAGRGFKNLLKTFQPEQIEARFVPWFASDDKHISGRGWRIEDFFGYFNRLKEGPIYSWETQRQNKKEEIPAWMKEDQERMQRDIVRKAKNGQNGNQSLQDIQEPIKSFSS